MINLPEHVKWDVRICFAIKWFATEEDALTYDEHVRKQGITYNGGFYHGRPCGRDKSWDTEENGKALYAVTC